MLHRRMITKQKKQKKAVASQTPKNVGCCSEL